MPIVPTDYRNLDKADNDVEALLGAPATQSQRAPDTGTDSPVPTDYRNLTQPSNDVDALLGSSPAKAQPNDVDSLLSGRDAEKRLKLSVDYGAEYNPKEAARILRLKEVTSLPEEVVSRNADRLDKMTRADAFDVPAFAKSSPIISEWLSESPTHVAASWNDLPRLGSMERILSRPSYLDPIPEAELQEKARNYARAEMEAENARGPGMKLHPEIATEETLYQKDLERRRKDEAFISGEEPIGIFEQLGRRLEENPLAIAPYANQFQDLAKAKSLYDAAQAAVEKKATPEQMEMLTQAARMNEAQKRRGTTFGADVASIVGNSMVFGGEFAMSGGAYAAGKKLLYKEGARQAAEGVVKKGLQLALEGAGWAAGSAAQTATAGIGRIATEATRRMTPEMEVQGGGDAPMTVTVNPNTEMTWQAQVPKAVVSTFAELASERTGGLLAWADKPIAKLLFGSWAKSHPGATVEAFQAVLKAAGVSGILGEMGEEEFGKVIKHVGGAEEYKLPTAKELATQAVAFAIPGATTAALSRVTRSKVQADTFKKFGDEIAESETFKTNPAVMEKIIQRVAEKADQPFVYSPITAWVDYWRSKDKDPGDAATEILGSREAYDEAVRQGTDLAIPTSRYAVTIAPSEHNAFFHKQLRWEGNENLPEAEDEAKRVEAADKETTAQGEDPVEAEASQIKEAHAKQLESAGMAPEEAQAAGVLHSDQVKTRAKIMGLSPAQYLAQFPLEVQEAGVLKTLPQDALAITEPEPHVFEQGKIIDGSNIFNSARKAAGNDPVKPGAPIPKVGALRVVEQAGGKEWGLFEGDELVGFFKSEKDAKNRIKALRKANKAIEPREKFAARFSNKDNLPKAQKAVEEAQDPKLGPYVPSKDVGEISWIPNFQAEPTGVIGPEGISESFGKKETDPLKWADRKYGVTLSLIQKHKEQGKPLVINTSSDLVAADNYIEAMPEGTKVNMYLLLRDEELNRIIFPGNASRLRQEQAVDRLREKGIQVTTIEPTLEDIIKVKGKTKLTKMLGPDGLAAIERAIPVNDVELNTVDNVVSGVDKFQKRRDAKKADEPHPSHSPKEAEFLKWVGERYGDSFLDMSDIEAKRVQKEFEDETRSTGKKAAKEAASDFPLVEPGQKAFAFRTRDGFLVGPVGEGAAHPESVFLWLRERGVWAEPVELSEIPKNHRDIIAQISSKDRDPHIIYELNADYVTPLNSAFEKHPDAKQDNSAPGIKKPQNVDKINYAFSSVTKLTVSRFGTPDGNLWLATAVDRDGKVTKAVASSKDEARDQAASGGTQYEKLPAKTLMAENRETTLIVGANNFIRTKVPFFLLQQLDIHLVTHPSEVAGEVKVGAIAFPRIGNAQPFYVGVTAKDMKSAIDSALNSLLIEHAPQDEMGEEKSSPKSESKAKESTWLTHWVYRQSKVSLKDALAFTPAPAPKTFEQARIPKDDEIKKLRARVKQLETELRTSDKTGLRNNKAFNEDEALGWPVVASLDMDGLKRLNSFLGYDLADGILKQLGGLMLEAEGDGKSVRLYHRSGDEFAGRFKDEAAAEEFLANLQASLDVVDIELEDDGGAQYFFDGIGVSYGAGESHEKANNKLNEQKQRRLVEGKRQDYRVSGPPARLREIRGRQAPRGEKDREGAPGKSTEELDQDPTDPRGRITFLDKKALMTLFGGSDASTPMHEGAHYWLERTRQDVAILSAKDPATLTTEQRIFLEDAEATLKWLGVSSWAEVKREQHEQFARGQEAFLREGKAPNSSLQRVFNQFKEWLGVLYRQAEKLNVELSPEMRAVYGRMFAMEEEVLQAQRQQEMTPLFNDFKSAGMSEEYAHKYALEIREARDAAEAELLGNALEQEKKKLRKEYQDIRAQVKAEVEAEVNEEPVYLALSILQKGTLPDGSPAPAAMQNLKLDRDSLKEDFPELVKKLPRPYVYAKEGGISADDAATLFGFRSASEMLSQMVMAENRDALVERLTNERMEARTPDAMKDGQIAVEAMKAIHNDKQAELYRKELEYLISDSFATFKQLTKRIAKPLPALARVREQAAVVIRRKIYREINPLLYQRAEARAGREAMELFLKGDVLGAFEAKERQLLNHELYRAAVAAKEDMDQIAEYGKSFGQSEVRARLGKAGSDYLEQADAIVERFDFRKGASYKAIDKRKTLLEWVKEQEAEGLEVNVPEKLLNEAYRESYKNLPYSELLEVRDTLTQIQHLAKLKNELLLNAKLRDLEAAETELVSTLQAHHKMEGEPEELTPTLKERFKAGTKEFLASHTRMEFLFEFLDGGKAHGAFWNLLFKPFVDAESAETQRAKTDTETLKKIFGAYTRKERAQWFRKPVFLEGTVTPKFTGNFTKSNALSIALNWGNEYNRLALLEGYGWHESQVELILDTLDARDWAMVQALWNHIDSYWPEARDLQKEITGLAPQKVQAFPFTTKFGQMQGGYYPIKFDNDRSYRQFQLDEKASLGEAFGHSTKAMTRHGHLIERQGTGGKPLLLNLSVLTGHLAQVRHDITHRRAIIDVARLVNRKKVREGIEAAAGSQMYRQLNPWLKSIAGDTPPDIIDGWEKILSRARSGATVVNLGFKVTSALAQTLGTLNVVEILGPTYFAKGLTHYNPLRMKKNAQFIKERSPMMAMRLENYDRDIRDFAKSQSPITAMDVAWFYHIGFTDLQLSYGAWLGAYKKAMDGAEENIDKGDETAAIDFADSIVRKTMAAGAAKDLAQVQRGGELKRLFTAFYSQLSIQFNLMQRATQDYALTKDMGKLASSVLLLWFLPSVLQDLVKGRGPDDEDEWLGWLSRKIGLYPFQSLVLARDVVSALDRKIESGRKADFTPTPAIQAFEALVNTMGAAGKLGTEEEFTRGDLKEAALTAGYFAKLPTRQVWMTGEYLYNAMTGEEEPEGPGEAVWRALVTGKKWNK